MAASGRGRYKIFLGMAAGVGKTYRMLQEGQAEQAAGRDVVIGYLEPHDRAETTAQAEGLERLPRRRVEYRGTELEEMDLPAIFPRPRAVPDRRAGPHQRSRGRARKRYEDIEDVLDAGIDVFSTVNVQHLETLNDRVAELTGVRVQETFPDSVLAEADEVVLIDLTPEALIQRLREGKVYPAERVQAALKGFFRIENLSTLREVALREVAEEVEAKRVWSRRSAPATSEGDRRVPQAVGERLLALVTPRPRSQRLVRRAWRSAQRLGAELDLLWVKPPPPARPDTPAPPAKAPPRAPGPRAAPRLPTQARSNPPGAPPAPREEEPTPRPTPGHPPTETIWGAAAGGHKRQAPAVGAGAPAPAPAAGDPSGSRRADRRPPRPEGG